MIIKLFIYSLVAFLPHCALALNSSIQVSSDARLTHIGNLINAQITENTRSGRLTITVGPESLERELRSKDTNEILAVYTTSTEFDRIIDSASKASTISNRRISAIFMDLDPRYQVALANLLSPTGKKSIAVTPETEIALNPLFESYISNKGTKINYLKSGDTKGMLSEMDSADVLIAYKDDTLFNELTIKPIIASLYRRKKFLIGTSNKLTSSGALASVYVNIDGYINQVIMTINQIPKGSFLNSQKYTSAVDISVNRTLAKSLGFYSQDIDEYTLKERMLQATESKGIKSE